MSKLRLSYSSLSEFATCPRKWYYSRVERRMARGGVGRPIAFGQAFHRAQAVLWAHEGDEHTRLADTLKEWAVAATQEGLSFEDTLLGEVLLIGYSIRWDDFRLTGNVFPVVEQSAVVPVLDLNGNPDPDLELVVVLDVRCMTAEGETIPVEHKTTSSAIDEGSAYWTRMDASQQVSLYYLALADNGHHVGHVLLDVTRAPELKRQLATPPEKRQFYVKSGAWGKAGDPKPGTRLEDETADEFSQRVRDMVLANPNAYYARHKLYRTEEELAAVRADLWMQGQLLKYAVDNNLFPRNMPEACHKYGRPCAYLPVCRGEVSIDDDRIYTIRPRREEKAEDSLWK